MKSLLRQLFLPNYDQYLLVFEVSGPPPSNATEEAIMEGMKGLSDLGFSTEGATITKGVSYTPGQRADDLAPDGNQFDYVMVFPSKGPQPSKQSIATVEKAVVALEKLGYVMKRIQIFQGYSYPIER